MSKDEILKNTKRVVVKTGSSILTTEGGYLSPKKVGSVVSMVTSLIDTYGKEVILVSSGAIAAGMHILCLKKRPVDLALLQAAASVGQGELIHTYQTCFKPGHICAQILLTSDGLKSRKRYLNARNTINKLLSLGVVPIVNENDTIATDEIKFGDNDSLAAQVALMVDADLLVLLSDVDGFYFKDGGKKRVIKEITKVDFHLKEHLYGKEKEHTAGGMESKLNVGFMLMKLGIPVVIANGNRKMILSDIMEGKGNWTFFYPVGKKKKSKKRWILFSKASGGIIIDSGAKKAITDSCKSLLASGIVDVVGTFSFGDTVNILDEAGLLIAKGITNFSSGDILKIKGHKTSSIKKILKRNVTYSEVVLRDNLINC